MARLLRPHVPVEVRVRVALRQLGEIWPDEIIRLHQEARSSMGHLLKVRLERLAELLGCAVRDLRLDHDPALGAREKVFRKGQHVGYRPDANDPEHLRYRPHGPEFHGSHLVKTNVRGDGAQFPDRVLIKRARRREREAKEKPSRRPPSGRGKKQPRNRRPPGAGRRGKIPTKIPRRPNPWPPKGSRKLRWRRT